MQTYINLMLGSCKNIWREVFSLAYKIDLEVKEICLIN
jgi:hypothetical protein